MYKITLIILLTVFLNNNINSKTKDNEQTKNKENKTEELKKISKEASLSWIKEYKQYKLSKKEKDIIKEIANTRRIHILDLFGFKIYLKFNRQDIEQTRHSRFIEAVNEGNTRRQKLRD